VILLLLNVASYILGSRVFVPLRHCNGTDLKNETGLCSSSVFDRSIIDIVRSNPVRSM
jgi:hypothetical protein